MDTQVLHTTPARSSRSPKRHWMMLSKVSLKTQETCRWQLSDELYSCQISKPLNKSETVYVILKHHKAAKWLAGKQVATRFIDIHCRFSTFFFEAGSKVTSWAWAGMPRLLARRANRARPAKSSRTWISASGGSKQSQLVAKISKIKTCGGEG